MSFIKFRDVFFKYFDLIEKGSLKVTTPDGKEHCFQGRLAGENADIHIHDWSVVKNLTLKGDIGFCQDYFNKKWDTSNLISLITLALSNDNVSSRFLNGNKIWNIFSRLSYLSRINTLRGSRKNILQHYDLGNNFYKLWLDPSMTYSSALFAKKDDSLEQAQNHKYNHILKFLSNRSGRMLEIGCGWGGFARRALEYGDFSFKGLTLSKQQHDYATDKLQKNAHIVMEDYRLQQGKFDHIVSIEMFEAVGKRYWKTYFKKIASLLNHGAKAVIQTITIDEKYFDDYLKRGDFIRSFIFPGGLLPSLPRFIQDAGNAGLKSTNIFSFGHDYAKTLKIWLENFDQKRDQIIAQGFDDRFIRLWRFYLASCSASFATRRTNVMQVELSHA